MFFVFGIVYWCEYFVGYVVWFGVVFVVEIIWYVFWLRLVGLGIVCLVF